MRRGDALRSRLRERIGADRWRRTGVSARRLLRPSWAAPYLAAPVSAEWGFDRGVPVDRWYIETFLAAHGQDITGAVLEVRSSDYTDRFGHEVRRREVLDIDATNPAATVVADLAAADHVAPDQFDCFLLNQTLQFIPDVQAALHHAHRLLRPGGVLLATVPSVSRIAPRYGLEADLWRFTAAGARRLVDAAFPGGTVDVVSMGSLRAACAFLEGRAADEVRRRRLERHDPYFPVIVAVRARKAGP